MSEGGENSAKGWLGKALGWVNGPSRAMAFGVLVAVMAFFSRDVLSSWRVRGEIRDLRQRREKLRESIASDSILLEKLDDPEFLERYARENYLMRREGDEVYVISDK